MRTRRRIAICLSMIASMICAPAWADRFRVDDPVYREECGSCHVAYPRELLRPAAWAQVLARLDRHYGVDASTDPESLLKLGRWLGVEKPSPSGGSDLKSPLPRITTTRWFQHEHDEVSPKLWRHPKVRSASNCDACHQGASQGDYRERSIRLPR
ncbi:MAG: cytochrome C [Burkholderiaceae bacterium]